MIFRKILKSLLLVSVCMICFSCTMDSLRNVKIEPPPAAIHTVATSVTNWDDYVDELQPEFKLNPEKALELAVPETLQDERVFFDAFRSKLALKLAPSYDMPGGFGADDTAGKNISSSAFSDQPGSSDSSSEGDKNPEKTKIADPYLHYWAASSLYQEVKLINRYLRDLNYNKEKYHPYIVQFLVDQVPYKRNASFDTYITMSFFNNSVSQGHTDGGVQISNRFKEIIKSFNELPFFERSRDSEIQEITNNIKQLLSFVEDPFANSETRVEYKKLHTTTVRNIESALEKYKNNDDDIKGLLEALTILMPFIEADKVISELTNPIVVPMLVADQVEAAIVSRRAEQLKQMALTLAAAYAGIGGQIDLEKTSRDIQAAIGSQINSRFTIGRVSDNTVRINLSARQTPSRSDKKSDAISYIAEKRNHRVSLLVLVPKNIVDKEIFFGTRATFVDPSTGKIKFTSSNRVKASPLLSYLIPVKDPKNKNGSDSIHPLFNKQRLEAMDISLKMITVTENGVIKEIERDPAKVLTEEDRLFLESTVRNNYYREFIIRLQEKLAPETDSFQKFVSLANSLWVELSELSIGSQYTTGSVYIKGDPKAEFGSTTNCIIVDDKQEATAIIPVVGGIIPRKLIAKWSWEINKNPVVFIPKKISLEGNGRLLKLYFDSPLAMKIAPISSVITLEQGTTMEPKILHVAYQDISNPPGKTALTFRELQKTVPAGKDVSVVLFSDGKEEDIAAYQANCSTAIVGTDKVKNCIILTVENAKIADGSNEGNIEFISNKKFSNKLAYAITGPGVISFKMSQLVAGETFKLNLQAPSGYKTLPTIEIAVSEKTTLGENQQAAASKGN